MTLDLLLEIVQVAVIFLAGFAIGDWAGYRLGRRHGIQIGRIQGEIVGGLRTILRDALRVAQEEEPSGAEATESSN